MSTLISITSYLKPLALEQLIVTLLEHGYDKGNTLMICCDNGGIDTKPVYDKFRKDCKLVLAHGAERQGISANKNRGIKYFLQKTHFEKLLLLDDDILFKRPGMLEHLEEACQQVDLPLMTGLWTDFNGNKEENILGASNRGWFTDFPEKGGTELVSLHEGCHGCLKYLKREAVEKVGYFHVFPEKYGFEHSNFCSRILKEYEVCPRLYPILRTSPWFFCGNKIPNNYEVDIETVFKVNGAEHDRLLNEIYNGRMIYEKDHGLNKKKERIYDY